MNNMMTKKEANAGGGLLVAQFMIGEATFGVDARRVLEVVKVGEWTPVHGAPEGVLGIRNLRGRIVTVIDFAVQLGLGQVVPGPASRLLIMEQLGDYYGFLVDAVTEAVALDETQITEPPSSLAADLRNRLTGVWREGRALTAIIEPDSLFI